MINELQNILKETNQFAEISRIELIQSLWNNYGTLNRVHTDIESFIVKYISFPKSSSHPKGWNSSASHDRKVRSYEVEMNWYNNHNSLITSAYSPRLIYSQNFSNSKLLVLEDLQLKRLKPIQEASSKQVKLCLKWLAHFHAHYMDNSISDLWKIGTYWNLETRQEELEIMKDQNLKDAAPLLDKKLNCANFQTLVHGDAKLANFLFCNSDNCAAVDFQYVGRGAGIKDIVYFLSSVFNEQELKENQDFCLDYYFQELKLALDSGNNFYEIEKEWRELYTVAWADFYRFLIGWSPDHFKINSYSQNMTKKALECI